MPAIELPPIFPRVKEEEGKRFLFDPLRRRFVAATPEEWVRQRFTAYLITEKGYPAGLLAHEVRITLNGTAKRCDTVVYDSRLAPLAIIEYKAPGIGLSEDVFRQVSRYNMALHVPFLMLCNGKSHLSCRVNYAEGTYSFLADVPSYKQILACATSG